MSETSLSIRTNEKLRLFRTCFSGLDYVYGTYDVRTGRAWQVKEPVTDRVLLRHLQGIQPYGVYLLLGNRTRATVADFDAPDPQPPFQFVLRAQHYAIPAYIERSKSKGWHVWVFFPEAGVDAAKARRTVQIILSDIEMPTTEVFPKQDRLGGNATHGNFINAPLFGGLVPNGRTVFVDPGAGFRPHADQWAVLERVRRVPESLLDQILEINGDYGTEAAPSSALDSNRIDATPRSYGLPPCAQRMLAGGVSEYQRVSCFRLAIQLKKAGIPQDLAIACLRAWATKNRPGDGKPAIAPEEVARQTISAYARGYRGCGCDDPAVKPFCNAACTIRNRRQSENCDSPNAPQAALQGGRTSNDE